MLGQLLLTILRSSPISDVFHFSPQNGRVTLLKEGSSSRLIPRFQCRIDGAYSFHHLACYTMPFVIWRLEPRYAEIFVRYSQTAEAMGTLNLCGNLTLFLASSRFVASCDRRAFPVAIEKKGSENENRRQMARLYRRSRKLADRFLN